MVYIRYEKSTESGWNDWEILSVKKETEEDGADGYEDEVQDEDLAELSDSVTVWLFFLFWIFLMLTGRKTVWNNLHVMTTFMYLYVCEFNKDTFWFRHYCNHFIFAFVYFLY